MEEVLNRVKELLPNAEVEWGGYIVMSEEKIEAHPLVRVRQEGDGIVEMVSILLDEDGNVYDSFRGKPSYVLFHKIERKGEYAVIHPINYKEV